MVEVKWIKIVTDIFDDEKMLLIESLPSADSIIVIWFKLLCLSGKNNNSGVFMLNERIAYTDEMLSIIFRRDVNIVRLALKTFEQFGMIEIINNVITIPNWSKHQTLDQLEERKEYMKKYMKKYRENQKLIANGESKVNSKANSKANVNSLEEDIEEDIEEDTEGYVEPTKVVSSTKVQPVIEKWNSLGLQKLISIKSGTTRYKLLQARLKDYGLDKVLEAIDNINNSSFLKGQNNKGWTISFEWLIKPNNFIKVLEGNYKDKEGVNSGSRINSNIGKNNETEDQYSGYDFG